MDAAGPYGGPRPSETRSPRRFLDHESTKGRKHEKDEDPDWFPGASAQTANLPPSPISCFRPFVLS
jgi:hypothetical protein